MIDKYISVEIPDPKIEPLGYALVSEHMVHGPYGQDNPKCPCMKNNRCSKHFPKPYQEQTTLGGVSTFAKSEEKRRRTTTTVVIGRCTGRGHGLTGRIRSVLSSCQAREC
jgi:hypothetical protein